MDIHVGLIKDWGFFPLTISCVEQCRDDDGGNDDDQTITVVH